MHLTSGSRVGPYEILAPLGAGGMGEVYKARDTKLNRDVAIKVLPAAFAQDSDRMARFQRAAQALAALNHPNIAQIYRMEDAALGVLTNVPSLEGIFAQLALKEDPSRTTAELAEVMKL